MSPYPAGAVNTNAQCTTCRWETNCMSNSSHPEMRGELEIGNEVDTCPLVLHGAEAVMANAERTICRRETSCMSNSLHPG